MHAIPDYRHVGMDPAHMLLGMADGNLCKYVTRHVCVLHSDGRSPLADLLLDQDSGYLIPQRIPQALLRRILFSFARILMFS